MHLPTLTRDEVRQVDRRAIEEFGLSGLVLMENAGRGVVDVLVRLGIDAPVVVCCGKGNNAGDGFVLARHLDLRRADVRVLLFADPAELTGDAAINFGILEKCGVAIDVFSRDIDEARLQKQLDGAGWIVDALLGTGAKGDPRPPYDRVIAALNEHAAPKLAIDLPSGLDCDSGRPGKPTIRAAHTCTFVAAKPGFFSPGAAHYTGQLHVLDIGAPRCLVDQMLAKHAASQ